jgi:hypothetical protein
MRTQCTMLCRALLLVVGLTGTAAVALVHAAEPAVYLRDSVIFGATYSAWSAAWQQWANSIPAAEHPLLDNADCSKGQSGPVWFLGGKFCSTEDPECPSKPAQRSCTVPSGKALYFPVVNFACLDGEAKEGLCGDAGPFITQMRAFIGAGIDQTTDLQVTVDGDAMNGDLKEAFRVQSPVYTAVLPDGNLLQAIGESSLVGGTYWGVDDGVYIMLQPLPPGKHTLNFHGRFPQYDFTLDFTYTLTVKAKAN